jgi:ribonuclease VapC
VSKVVLDASAVLALINDEPGAEKLPLALLSEAVISAVNLAEVHSKLVGRGMDAKDAWEAALSPVSEVVAFSAEQAKTTGDLVAGTRRFGLSLGDRACLALAAALKAPVYTADKSWKKLNLSVQIHLIR